MNIQEAKIEELNEILILQKECYRETGIRYNDNNIPPLTQTLVMLEEEFKKMTILVAVEDSKIIGSIRAYQTENSCILCKIIVDPAYQNRGIGSKLIKEIETNFNHIERFELFTGFKDEKNIALYQKRGYSIYKEKKLSEDFSMIFLQKDNRS